METNTIKVMGAAKDFYRNQLESLLEEKGDYISEEEITNRHHEIKYEAMKMV